MPVFLQQNGSVFFLFLFFHGKGSYLSDEQLKYCHEKARNQWQIPLTSIPFDFLRFESNFELLCLGSQKRHHFGFTVNSVCRPLACQTNRLNFFGENNLVPRKENRGEGEGGSLSQKQAVDAEKIFFFIWAFLLYSTPSAEGKWGRRGGCQPGQRFRLSLFCSENPS